MMWPTGRGVGLVMLLVLAATAGLAGSAQAIVFDVWYTMDSAVGETRPFDGGGWIDAPQNNSPSTYFNLGAGQDVWFAMDNFWYPNMVKDGYFQVSTNTRGFFYDNVIPVVGGYGYSNDDQPGEPLPSSSWATWSPVNSSPYTFTGEVDFTISPQPSWEWIRLSNSSGKAVTINSASGWAICTPEPSLGILLLAGIIPLGIGLKRRYRNSASARAV